MDDIDAIISEAQTSEQAQSVVKTPDNKEQTPLEPKVEDTPKKEDSAETEEHDDSELSDRAKKILAKKNSAIGKKTAKLYEARAMLADKDAEIARVRDELAKLRQPKTITQQVFDPNRPREEDFPNDYGSYLKADALYDLRKELAERDNSAKKTNEDAAQVVELQKWESERKASLDQAGDAYIKDNPDLAELVQQHAEIIRAFSPEINRAIYESDPMEVVRAFHHMARNGTLDDISDMSYADAKVAIVRAANARTISKAPEPLRAARGSGSSKGDIYSQTPDELMEWLKA